MVFVAGTTKLSVAANVIICVPMLHASAVIVTSAVETTPSTTEIIELQLSHKERSSVKAAYNQAQYMTERIEMMEKWSGFINSLKNV